MPCWGFYSPKKQRIKVCPVCPGPDCGAIGPKLLFPIFYLGTLGKFCEFPYRFQYVSDTIRFICSLRSQNFPNLFTVSYQIRIGNDTGKIFLGLSHSNELIKCDKYSDYSRSPCVSWVCQYTAIAPEKPCLPCLPYLPNQRNTNFL